MPDQASSVLISGIGVAGPTLAYWLLESGVEPVLVERAPQLRSGGYVIDFWGVGYDIAERMHLLPELAREGYHVREFRLVDGDGKRIAGFGADVFRSLTNGRYLSIPRSGLAELLFRTIEGRCEAIFGDTIASLQSAADGVLVAFENAPPRRFDLVIGADGLHSRVRSLAFGPQKSFETFLGYVVAAFEATGYRPRDEGVYVAYSIPGKQVARFALRADRTMFLVVLSAPEPPLIDSHDVDSQKAYLRSALRGAGWECPQILDALDRAPDLYFDRVSQIRMDTWSRGRIALVGDAAFAPSLLAGQGSALAMTAAFTLAGEIARARGRYEEAFARYQDVLGPFIRGKLRAAEGFGGWFAPTTRLGIFLRNQATRALRIPAVARFLIGRSLLDRLEPPDYTDVMTRRHGRGADATR